MSLVAHFTLNSAARRGLAIAWRAMSVATEEHSKTATLVVRAARRRTVRPICSQLDGGGRYRLPSPSEVQLLAPFAAGGPIAYPEWAAFEIAYGRDPDCAMHEPYGSMLVNAEGEISWWCSTPDRGLATVCVASWGPAPQLPDP